MGRIRKPLMADPETHKKIKDLSRELYPIEGKDVSMPEVLRRTFNVPTLKEILFRDAKEKRELRRYGR